VAQGIDGPLGSEASAVGPPDVFGQEPDPSLVRLVRSKTSALAPAEVRKSLGRLRTTFDFPVVATPPVDHAEVSRKVTPKREVRSATLETATRQIGAGTPWRHVSLTDLIGGGLVRLPFAIEHRYRGQELTARIEDASHIVFAGAPYDSLSTAGGVARNSVAGPFPGREIPQTNGWTFWEFRSPRGELRPLDDLRRELYERKVVTLTAPRAAGA
jgi:hypothetical protein